MSVLLGGMSGRYIGAAAAPTGLSLREKILRNLEDTLMLVQSVRAEAVGTNTPGVTYAAGGAYTGTVTRRYRVQVVTAGASGTARVTVTDATPTAQKDLWTTQDAADDGSLDDGPVAAVVTSGAAKALGTAGLGATITLTFTGSLALGDAWYVWAGPFQSSVGLVTRKQDSRNAANWIEMQVPLENEAPGPTFKHTGLLSVVLQAYIARTNDVPGDLEVLLADVRNALMLDWTRGAWAIKTDMPSNVGYAMSDVKARGGFDLRLEILYRTRDTDTRSR